MTSRSTSGPENRSEARLRPRDIAFYLARLADLEVRKSQQAMRLRCADNTARGERTAGEADLDAAALRWALRHLEAARR